MVRFKAKPLKNPVAATACDGDKGGLKDGGHNPSPTGRNSPTRKLRDLGFKGWRWPFNH